MNGPGWVSGTDTVLSAQNAATLTNGNANALLSPSGRFAQWYVDDSTVNITFASTLSLKQCSAAGICSAGTPVSTGTFQYSCAGGGVCDSSAAFGTTDGFFPLDGKGWVALGKEVVRYNHNFSFTTETRNWFVFAGGEQLSFYGDDDVWVFVNGQLTLDIGGIHSQTNGKFTLGTDGNATTCVENGVTPNDGGLTNNCSPVNLGLVKGKVYEIDVFNAERHVSGSNFQLTLQGFNGAPTVCTPICGDGFVAGTEQCDQGAANVSPTSNTYGKCTTSCQLGPYCGDKTITNPPEACDNGLNIDSYTSSAPTALQCGPGCVAPTYCGDKIIQKVNGEECDDGTALNQNTYGHCQTNCKLGARCGDGVISNGEQCDAGANNGALSSACDANCQLKCGNGVVDAGEQCDAGSANGTAASSCDSNCQNKCGNGVIDAGEQCDDGASKNDGSYNNCNANCTKAPSCGDGIVQNPPEICDNGANNSSSAYGTNSCNLSCLPGGYCGDGVINGTEKCDDGKNTGLPGSCKTDCSAYVPSVSCGDGIIQAPEQCDDGSSSTTGNGTAASKCDTSCRRKCGNGVLDQGEQCDNGVNDGSYGTCTSTCKLAPYCGDGIKNGNEQCDAGANNVDAATAYGTGVCTKACKAAPFCGDGKIQPAHEQCEGNVNCSNCIYTGPK
jgi:fibro-slime domain-containing protein